MEPELELDDNLGEVSIEITGDYETEKTGTASFWGAGESEFSNDYGYSWQLATTDELFPEPGVQTFRLDFLFADEEELVSRPAAGVYPIGDSSFAESVESPVYSAVYARIENSSGYFSGLAVPCGVAEEYSHTGELTIMSSTPELVTGSFEFEAYFCNGEINETVNISGEFTAPRADLIDS